MATAVDRRKRLRMRAATLVARTPAARLLVLPTRVRLVCRTLCPEIRSALVWLVRSREHTNLTYDLADTSRAYLACFIAQVGGISRPDADAYIREIEEDDELRGWLRTRINESPFRWITDPEPRYGRRIGWYALARALKPRLVIETGVDKGLGAVVLAAALLRNAAEGHPGRYLGTDINPRAGFLLGDPYDRVCDVVLGDSAETLSAFEGHVDLFLHDSDHTPAYERSEYEAIAPRLSEGAVLLTDNAEVTTVLLEYAAETGRDFLYWREEPIEHWSRGGGIGAAWRSR